MSFLDSPWHLLHLLLPVLLILLLARLAVVALEIPLKYIKRACSRSRRARLQQASIELHSETCVSRVSPSSWWAVVNSSLNHPLWVVVVRNCQAEAHTWTAKLLSLLVWRKFLVQAVTDHRSRSRRRTRSLVLFCLANSSWESVDGVN